MKTLSVQQPWAWLLVNEFKDIENRTWQTHIRGKVQIHAGKKFDNEGYEFVKDEFPEINLPEKDQFETGGIVGEVEIVDCVQESDSPWFFGPFGFVVKNGKPLQFVPCRGQLGFFELNNQKPEKNDVERVMIKKLLDCEDLTNWEVGFVTDIEKYQSLSEKQSDILHQIYDRRIG